MENLSFIIILYFIFLILLFTCFYYLISSRDHHRPTEILLFNNMVFNPAPPSQQEGLQPGSTTRRGVQMARLGFGCFCFALDGIGFIWSYTRRDNISWRNKEYYLYK
jgi:hypothetical protein